MIEETKMTELDTFKWASPIEYSIRFAVEIFAIIAVYKFVVWSAELFLDDSFNSDFLYALVFLPLVDVIKEASSFFDSCFTKVEMSEKSITCKSGFFYKNTDRLYLKDIDNIETDTNLIGEKIGYGAITLYSIGGNVHLPYLKEWQNIYLKLNEKIRKND